jgi:tetratricopeptide (TPR) repeat protein
MKTLAPWSARFLVGSLMLLGACADEPAAAAASTAVAPTAAVATPQAPVADAAIARYRLDLLQLAFQAASALPLQPHAKTRSRVQESVVMACLQLDLPRLALQFAERIPDWRRGACLADVAHYCALHGDAAEARRQLARAEEVLSEIRQDEVAQEWRRDTIRIKLSRAAAALGDPDAAARHGGAVEVQSGTAYDAAWAATVASRADYLAGTAIDAEIEQLAKILGEEGTGHAYTALVTCVRLLDRCYADAERRPRLLELARQGDAKLPPDLRLAALVAVAKTAVDHADPTTALAVVRQARELAATVPQALHVPAQLAALRWRAGERDEARADFEQALRGYQDQREQMRQTKRADLLRPFAEASHAMADPQAGSLYELVVEEGMENPNSRPRAEDVAATCVSMAVHAFEPDAKLWARLREIVTGLGDPW